MLDRHRWSRLAGLGPDKRALCVRRRRYNRSPRGGVGADRHDAIIRPNRMTRNNGVRRILQRIAAPSQSQQV